MKAVTTELDEGGIVVEAPVEVGFWYKLRDFYITLTDDYPETFYYLYEFNPLFKPVGLGSLEVNRYWEILHRGDVNYPLRWWSHALRV